MDFPMPVTVIIYNCRQALITFCKSLFASLLGLVDCMIVCIAQWSQNQCVMLSEMRYLKH